MSQIPIDYKRLAVAGAFADQGMTVTDAVIPVIVSVAGEVYATNYGATDSPSSRLIIAALRRVGPTNAAAAVAKLKVLPGGANARIVLRPRFAIAAADVRRGLRNGLLVLVAIAAGAFVAGLESVPQSPTVATPPLSSLIESNFDKLIDELGKAASKTVETRKKSPGSGHAMPLRCCASIHGDDVPRDVAVATSRLLRWAERERITLLRVCPTTASNHVADYLWPDRRVRICPDMRGYLELQVLSHEFAHHLQGVRGRLGRKALTETEADAVTAIALRVSGFPVEVRELAYLSQRGDHVRGLAASRAAIEEMAIILARVLRGEDGL